VSAAAKTTTNQTIMSELITSQEQRVADGARRVSADLAEWRAEVEQFLAAQKQELAALLETVTSTSLRQAPPNEWGTK